MERANKGDQAMQFILNLWDRLRKFDPRSLTPAQIVVGIAAILVGFWAIGLAMSALMWLLNIIMPFALVVVLSYFGYNFLKSRSENLPAEAMKSGKEKRVDEALANVEAVKRGEDPNMNQKTANVLEDEASMIEEPVIEDNSDEKLVVKQIINPETGFKEPDIARLIEREEAKLKEVGQVNDSVMAQLEARRKRLKGSEGE
jgi:hypothetical protein